MHGNIADLQWVVAGYALTFACLLLTAGSVGDQIGTKKTFVAGLLLFVVTSLGCGLARNFTVLTFFRLFQGIGAAMLVPTSLALIHTSYESAQDRAKAIGIWAGIGGIAAASGPILGSVLATWFGWRAIFFINIPIGLAGVFLTIKYVPTVKRSIHAAFGFDICGQLLIIASITALSIGLIEAGRLGWSSSIVLSSFIIFVFTFSLFLFTEQKVASPMFPLYLFKIPTFSTAILVGMILNISFYGILFLLPLYFQQIRGYSVLETGFALLPMMGIVTFASYWSGKMTSITGPKIPMVIGLIVGVFGFLILLTLREQSPAYWLLILPLIALGFGVAYTMPAATVAIMHSVPKDRTGLASGALNASRQIGSLLGVAIFGTLVGSGQFIDGMHVSLIIASFAFLCGVIATVKGIKNI